MIEYKVVLKSQSGVKFDELGEFEFLRYEKKRNDIGLLQLKLKGDYAKRAQLILDTQIEIWRKDDSAGIAWYCDAEYFYKAPEKLSDDDGVKTLSAEGAGLLAMLDGVLVIPATGQEMTSVNAAADSAIYSLADSNVGAGAGARQKSNLSIASVSGTASSVTRDVRRSEYLLRTMQQLADAARKAGTGVEFEVVGAGRDATLAAGYFKLKFGVPYLGTDKRTTLVFSEERGNMRQPRLKIDAAKATRVYVAGAGEAASQVIQQVVDTTAESESPWNRKEAWLDAGDQADTAALTSAGNAYLRDSRKKTTFRFQPVETEATHYGRDWNLSDVVMGRFDGADYPEQITSVRVTVQPSGDDTEKIEVGMEDV
jgi:hypothetical protein